MSLYIPTVLGMENLCTFSGNSGLMLGHPNHMLISQGEQNFNLGCTEKYREFLHHLQIFQTSLCDIINDIINDVKTPSLSVATKM